jgi:hypothetical protein
LGLGRLALGFFSESPPSLLPSLYDAPHPLSPPS